MHAPGTRPPENRELRRYLQDLATVTALPAVWSAYDRPRIADGMAEVAVSILHLDFAYVRLEGSTGAPAVEAIHFSQPPDATASAVEMGRMLAPHIGGGSHAT